MRLAVTTIGLLVAALGTGGCGTQQTPEEEASAKLQEAMSSMAGAAKGNSADAENPVDIIHRIQGCKTEAENGDVDWQGGRFASCHFGNPNEILPNIGDVTIRTYGSDEAFEARIAELDNEAPQDGSAYLSGDRFIIQITAFAGKTVDDKAITTIGSQAGAKLVEQGD